MAQRITWQNDNWAFGCDFDDDFFKVFKRVIRENCRSVCLQTTGCTHFTWSQIGNGTCLLMSGAVSKNNALFKNDKTMVCGFISKRKCNLISLRGRFLHLANERLHI